MRQSVEHRPSELIRVEQSSITSLLVRCRGDSGPREGLGRPQRYRLRLSWRRPRRLQNERLGGVGQRERPDASRHAGALPLAAPPKAAGLWKPAFVRATGKAFKPVDHLAGAVAGRSAGGGQRRGPRAREAPAAKPSTEVRTGPRIARPAHWNWEETAPELPNKRHEKIFVLGDSHQYNHNKKF